MRKASSNFGRSGVYQCDCCKRNTRGGVDRSAEMIGLCYECYELAGIENFFIDGGASQPEAASYEKEAARLYAVLASRNPPEMPSFDIPGLPA